MLARCPRCGHLKGPGTSSICAECGSNWSDGVQVSQVERIRNTPLAPFYDFATTASLACAILAITASLAWQFIASYVLAVAALSLVFVAALLGAWVARSHPIVVVLELCAPSAAATFLLGLMRGSTSLAVVGGLALTWHLCRWCRLVAKDCLRADWPMVARLHRTSGIFLATSACVGMASFAAAEFGFPELLSARAANGLLNAGLAGVAGTITAILCLLAVSSWRIRRILAR